MKEKQVFVLNPPFKIFQKRLGDKRTLIDPCKLEEEIGEENCCGQITIGFQPSLEQVALISQEGHVSLDSLTKDTKQLSKTCSELLPIVHSCLVQSVKSSEEESK